jgi:predicted SAM-dependent methyltransferase
MSHSVRMVLAGLFPGLRHLGYHLRAPQRGIKRHFTDKFAIRRYLDDHSVRKLQIGAGLNTGADWLNGDIDPVASGVIYLDASRQFPLDNDVFDYVFSEHMIEHIPFEGGRNMINECYRVLKPGGRIRICTPDLTKLLKLLRADRSKVEEDYIVWATREFIPSADTADPVIVINNYVRDWGHQFIYDETVLKRTLQNAGFTGFAQCKLGQSPDEQLRDLENVDRMPPGFLDIESMVIEAVKG